MMMNRSKLSSGFAAFVVVLICFLSAGNSASARDLGFRWTSHGLTHSMTLSIPDQVYAHYKKKPRMRNYSGYTIEDPGYTTIDVVAHALNNKSKDLGFSNWQTVNFIIAFVQHFDYQEEVGEYPRYPAETLVDGAGDCEDTSILLSAILRELGYDCVMLSPPKHMSVGIAMTGYKGQYYPYGGKKYYYVETTGKNWDVGEIPSSYQGNAEVYKLPGSYAGLQALAYDNSAPNPETDGKLFVSFYRSPAGESGVYNNQKAYRFTLRLEGDPQEIRKVKEVRYRREHRTFAEYRNQTWIRRTSASNKFASEWTGWGAVPIKVHIEFTDGTVSEYRIQEAPKIASL